MNLIQQGAEAKIYLDKNVISKNRTPKSYRHPQLDNQIRTRRTRSEAKILTKALNLKVNVPKVLSVDKFNIQIEYIKGDKLSETLNSYSEKKQFKVMQQLGKQVAIIHKNNIIHGDLTTSNTILSNDKLFLIDFGLGFISTKIEDKAVDLHLIKQALQAKHFQNSKKLFTAFKKGYQWQDSKKVTERLITVEKRGRYKH
ncbi:Kae1-associated serine/threonine protein kinase [Candidatus Pacearchaeota archaeon]|nr:Kae1-associated serine/threonine protein kinase [Candidatus Pacearchaeota archaeon]